MKKSSEQIHHSFQSLCSRTILIKLDSGSFLIGIDNHSFCSMSNSIQDFIGPIIPNKVRMKGFQGASAYSQGIGTVKWRIEDNDGKVHDIFIKDTLFVPDSTQRLSCPQQWAQQAQDHYPERRGTFVIQDDKYLELHWNQDRCVKTIEWDKHTNTAYTRTAPTYKNFRIFRSIFDYKQKKNESACSEHACICNSTVIQEDDQVDQQNIEFQDYSYIQRHDEDTNIGTTSDNPQGELLIWHYRLCHLSFAKLKILATLGIIPKYLQKVDPPKCSVCIFGGMTRIPWRTGSTSTKINVTKVNKPGDCVSVDQMESSTPGFIAQLKVRLTTDRYRGATIFVDHFSRHGYVYLQRTLSSNETFLAKRAFEAYSAKNGVRISHNHADNGRFIDNVFVQDINNQGQTISYSGVNEHFQNGIAEKRIRDIQDSARKILLHAQSKWPEVISANLRPYAVRNANENICQIPDELNGTSKFERFVQSEISQRMRNMHTLFCPVYALNNRLQEGKKINKWSPRARLGVNLGVSPRHARSISLVLNLNTGLVSPHFMLFTTNSSKQLDLNPTMGLLDHIGSDWQGLRKK